MPDNELTAMQQAAAALEPLDEGARTRALSWLLDKFAPDLAAKGVQGSVRRREAAEPVGGEETFADFYHLVDPNTDKERAVTAAQWLKQQGTVQFQAMELNSMLKDLGHGVSNITDALTSAMKERPSLVIQVRKSGSSKQARKLYKITDAGTKWVLGKTEGGNS